METIAPAGVRRGRRRAVVAKHRVPA